VTAGATSFWFSRSSLDALSADYLSIVEELVNIEIRQGHTTVIHEGDALNLRSNFLINSALGHWSRRFEWPWALSCDLNENDVVLEAGGGSGAFQFFLARRCRTVVNIDSSQAVLDDVELLSRRGQFHNVLGRLGVIENMPYPDGHFTKTFCTSVIEHTKDPRRCIAEIMRVTRPGGLVTLTLDVANYANDQCLLDIAAVRELFLAANIGQLPDMPEDAVVINVNDKYMLGVLCLRIVR
jgi:SAM-dependent methyltransferase